MTNGNSNTKLITSTDNTLCEQLNTECVKRKGRMPHGEDFLFQVIVIGTKDQINLQI